MTQEELYAKIRQENLKKGEWIALNNHIPVVHTTKERMRKILTEIMDEFPWKDLSHVELYHIPTSTKYTIDQFYELG